MAFVLDASVTACWAFDDEDHPVAAQALERLRTDQGVVPALWWFEVRNTLVVNERRGRIGAADSATFLRAIGQLRITTDCNPEEASVLALARTHVLSVYDASCLELALRENAPLATLDRDLIRAAKAERAALVAAPV
jgi:predicted nucleic acid-binding protein